MLTIKAQPSLTGSGQLNQEPLTPNKKGIKAIPTLKLFFSSIRPNHIPEHLIKKGDSIEPPSLSTPDTKSKKESLALSAAQVNCTASFKKLNPPSHNHCHQ